MCKDCGCGLPGEGGYGISDHHHDAHGVHSHAHHHDRNHDHDHDHNHDPHEDHDHGDHNPRAEAGLPGSGRRTVELRQAILAQNDRLAERNRGFFRARGVLTINVVSSPGSGKTTLLQQTVTRTRSQLRSAVVVGDLATDNDAERLRQSGTPVIQVTTGTVCHLDAAMIGQAVKKLPMDGLQLLIIENVGNLVCPASYDLGEDLCVVLLSVTEGEDKPLKYPPIFQAADAVVISKLDLAQACDFDAKAALDNIRRTAPRAAIFQLSAKTGEGMEAWIQFLTERCNRAQKSDPFGP